MSSLITEDVPRFWQAFDQIDAPDAEAQIQRLYLDPGSPGLRAFVLERIASAAELLAVLRSRRAFYASIRECSLATAGALHSRLEHLSERLAEVLPGYLSNDIFVVIGALNSGGTMGHEEGRTFAVIGLEFFCAGPKTATTELNAWERSVLMPPDILPAIAAHELIHTFQPHDSVPEHRRTLLLYCLAEGAAEYLGELVSGEVINRRICGYGLAYEEELKARFLCDIASSVGPEGWLYQGNQAKDEPADLGYFIGGRIMRAYHEQHRDKPDLIYDLLDFALREPEEFTRLSGYFD
ncbi:hypothetical protein [Deinococcus frigens]|uniref:hypothetical protein n=1 Tax=Deinococcus frigens TaxID=249403 RepID=UPI000495D835|nr:hypothetical protein [Deinococcus frigens]